MTEGTGPAAELSDIFASTGYAAASPPKRLFQPWHLPRKQFVRRRQWLAQVDALLTNVPPDEDLRYLGLPGPDLLDIRLFHQELCGTRRMRFLGFSTGARNPEQRVELNISLDEMRGFETVDERSHVVADDIRALARTDSVGHKSAVDAGPFDVINLDFCDNVLTEASDADSIYDAIAALFGLQDRRAKPWILLLTTRLDRSTVSADIVDKLDAMVAGNVDSCAEFSDAYAELVCGDPRVDGLLSGCAEDVWVDVFNVAVCKWMLGQAVAGDTKLEVKSCLSYRVAPGEGPDDIVSIALLLSPQIAPAPDSSGVATPSLPAVDECRMAAAMARRLGKRRLVDGILAEDADLFDEMASETRGLLGQARYSEDAYVEWLARQPRLPKANL